MEGINSTKFKNLVDGLGEKINLQIVGLRKEVLRTKKESESYKELTEKKLEGLQTKNAELCSVIRQSEVEFNNVYLKLTELFNKNKDISHKNEKLVLENSDLKTQLYDLEQKMILETALLLAKNQQLLKDKQVLLLDVKTVKTELDKARLGEKETRKAFKGKLTEFDKSSTDLRQSINELMEQKMTLETNLLQKNNDLKELNQKYQKLGHSLSTEISRHLTDKTELNEKIKRLEEKIQNMGAEILVEKSKNDKFRYELLKHKNPVSIGNEKRMHNIDRQNNMIANVEKVKSEKFWDIVENKIKKKAILQSSIIPPKWPKSTTQNGPYTNHVDCNAAENEKLDCTKQEYFTSMDFETGANTASTFEIITLSDSEN